MISVSLVFRSTLAFRSMLTAGVKSYSETRYGPLRRCRDGRILLDSIRNVDTCSWQLSKLATESRECVRNFRSGFEVIDI